MSIRLGELAKLSGAELQGDADFLITAMATPDKAQQGEMICVFSSAYVDAVDSTQASVIVIDPEYRERVAGNALFHSNPYLVFAIATKLFSPKHLPVGIHASAVIDANAEIAEDVSIGSNAVIEAGVKLAKGCIISAGCYIGARVEMGENSHLRPNVTILEDCKLGADVLIQSGTVIGGEGFGYAPVENGWHHIEQIGNVIIGDRVEIGCNVCIDRGALEPTVIADGVIIDNLVHVAHNVMIGENAAIAGCTGIAGSAKIGKNVRIAGNSGINGHIELAEGVTVTAMSRITKSVKEPNSSISTGTLQAETSKWRRNSVRFTQLDEMAKRLKQLEKKIEQLTAD